MPKLDWIGKQYVVNHTDELPFRLLKCIPETSGSEDAGDMQSTLKVVGELQARFGSVTEDGFQVE